jgi:hypothetical protein
MPLLSTCDDPSKATLEAEATQGGVLSPLTAGTVKALDTAPGVDVSTQKNVAPTVEAGTGL